jgi:hypothetical protein
MSMKRIVKVSNANRTHFEPSVHRKKRLGKIRLSDELSRRMSLRTHNLLLEFLKNDFGEVDQTMFRNVQSPYELIFCSYSSEKIDFNEVA